MLFHVNLHLFCSINDSLKISNIILKSFDWFFELSKVLFNGILIQGVPINMGIQ